jgi:CDP-diglyceride synthetase
MINDEIDEIWKSFPKAEKVKFEKHRLMLELQSNLDNLHKQMRSRDTREIYAAKIVIPMFILTAVLIPFLITKIASILVAIWSCFVIYKLRQTNNNKILNYNENYLIYLQQNKEYLQNQKKLLDSVFWWYIIPFLFCMSLFFIGFLDNSNKSNWVITTLLIGVVLFSVFIYIMNKRVSKNEFDGRISKIENLIKMMKSTEI